MIKDSDLEFFKSPLRRYLTVGFCFGWTLLEWFVWNGGIWSVVATALFAYTLWRLIITFPKQL
ncbi:hypothetical protein [Marinobacterium sp. LSUCC0821]|jgi:hypothetical protein|uniref:hypothetical protein n=1 Tax=Marinobacterium sp. LSUCC0821 TaxID=2668067 RepID=UPI001451B0FB|nr:hypothetical protein [Marinobacterium sp. LSUCC0821]QJD71357.1 hypothetical protein HH196_06440 [Marinobacterium sp. LSUCC0821]